MAKLAFERNRVSLSISVNGHLGCFHGLAIGNSDTMNTGEHVSFEIMLFSRCIPWSGVAASLDSSVCSFLRNLQFHVYVTMYKRGN